MQILLQLSWILFTSIYPIHFHDIDGADRSFAEFSGKKMLIVNISTGSSRTGQLARLQQLYQQYRDSLVIVAFPSNSFGTETRSNDQIRAFCRDHYHTTFLVAGKSEVAGTSRAAVYDWLASGSENAAGDIFITGDFQKILIDNSGEIMGIYAPEIDPLDSAITNAISNH